MAYQKAKGTRDFYPRDMELMNKLSNLFREQSIKYGYKEVESPAFENLNLLTEKEGEEIQSQIFVFEKRSDEQLGLRFDLTVPFTRMFIEKQKELPKPVKWFGIARTWRYENPQKGRLREFFQLNAEVFGTEKPEADAEIISLAIDCLLKTGLKQGDFIVKINNRDLLEGLLEGMEIKNTEEVIALIDKSSKMEDMDFINEMEKLNLKVEQMDVINRIIEAKDLDILEDFKLNTRAAKGLENLKNVLKFLEDKKNFIRISLGTARGLAYYTGTVFEIFDAEEKYRSIAGGGRYNNLVEILGGEKCPSTGFAIGFVTLQLLLEEKNLLPESELGVDYCIAVVGNVKEKAMEIANKLRKKSSVDMDLMERSLSKQLDYANSIKAKKVVIVGENDLKNNEVTVKDMNSGKEEKVKIDKI